MTFNPTAVPTAVPTTVPTLAPTPTPACGNAGDTFGNAVTNAMCTAAAGECANFITAAAAVECRTEPCDLNGADFAACCEICPTCGTNGDSSGNPVSDDVCTAAAGQCANYITAESAAVCSAKPCDLAGDDFGVCCNLCVTCGTGGDPDGNPVTDDMVSGRKERNEGNEKRRKEGE